MLWESIYNAIDDEVHGMVGALTARAEAQMLRLSVVYALLDGSHVVEVHHLEAAQAVWRYSEDTVAHVYGKATGDPVADRLLAALREAGEAGLDRQAQRDVFARNVPAARVAQARESLSQRGLVMTTTEDTGGLKSPTTRPRPRDPTATRRLVPPIGRSDRSLAHCRRLAGFGTGLLQGLAALAP